MYSRVYVEITNICNKSCSFCIGHSRQPKMMTQQEFVDICKKISVHTRYIYYHLMGEPTLHPSLPEFIKIAGTCGLKSVVTTNGTLLQSRGSALIEAGVYKVNISLHSFEDSSDKEFEEYIDMCLDFADIASSAGVLVILRLWNREFDGGRNAVVLDRLKKKFADGEWVQMSDGARIRHRLHLEYGDRFEWPSMSAQNMGDSVQCYGLCDHFAILCDGTVVACCMDSEGEISLGNVFEQDLTQILESPRAESIRDGFRHKSAVEELCRRCSYARRFKIKER